VHVTHLQRIVGREFALDLNTVVDGVAFLKFGSRRTARRRKRGRAIKHSRELRWPAAVALKKFGHDRVVPSLFNAFEP